MSQRKKTTMQANEKTSTILQPPINHWIEAFNTRNVAAIVALYTDDAELFDSGMPRPRHGRQEIERWFSWRFHSTSLTYTPINQTCAEDGQIVVSWIASGQGPRFFKRSFQVDGKSYFIVHAGLIQRQQGLYDHMSVLKQIVPLLKWLPAWVIRLIYAIYLWRGSLYVRGK